MIQEFSVSNFRSIKETQTISFLPNKRISNSSDEFLLIRVNEKVSLLKLGVLYGYNASGKSNIIKAFSTLSSLVLNGKETKQPIYEYDPFLLDEDYCAKPSVFHLIFFIEGIQYSYHLEFTAKAISKEILCGSPNGHKVTYFSRSFDDYNGTSKVSFSKECGLNGNDRLLLVGNTLNNLTVLYAYQKTNVSFLVFDKIIDFFSTYMMQNVMPRDNLFLWGTQKLFSDYASISFYEKLMNKADFQISNVEIRENPISAIDKAIDQVIAKSMPQEYQKMLRAEKDQKVKNLLFGHKTVSGNTLMFEYEKESSGTTRYFGLAAILKELIDYNHFICIDELETSLHPELVMFFLTMFLMNTSSSQMFISTHIQEIMDADYMRSDMVWFCEKNEQGASEYYQLQDFGLHKNIKAINYYKAGRLGAFPDLSSPIIEKGAGS